MEETFPAGARAETGTGELELEESLSSRREQPRSEDRWP